MGNTASSGPPGGDGAQPRVELEPPGGLPAVPTLTASGRIQPSSSKHSSAPDRPYQRQVGFVPWSIACTVCSRRRTRRDRMVSIRLIRSGVSSSSRQKCERSTISSRRSVVATIVADRGSPSSRLISPKKSPGCSCQSLGDREESIAFSRCFVLCFPGAAPGDQGSGGRSHWYRRERAGELSPDPAMGSVWGGRRAGAVHLA